MKVIYRKWHRFSFFKRSYHVLGEIKLFSWQAAKTFYRITENLISVSSTFDGLLPQHCISWNFYVNFAISPTLQFAFIRFSQQKSQEMKEYKCALTRENLFSGGCEQQWRRLACTNTQSDQRLWQMLIGKYHIKTCYKQNFTILASLCSRAGWSGYDLRRNPKDRFLSCRSPNDIDV